MSVIGWLQRAGARPSSYKIHPDWISEAAEVPGSAPSRGRRYHPSPYEFHGARSWPDRPGTGSPLRTPAPPRPHSAAPDLQHVREDEGDQPQGEVMRDEYGRPLVWGTGLCETSWSTPLKHFQSYAHPAPVRDRDVQGSARVPRDVTPDVMTSYKAIPARLPILTQESGRAYKPYTGTMVRPGTHSYKVYDNGVMLWVLDKSHRMLDVDNNPYTTPHNGYYYAPDPRLPRGQGMTNQNAGDIGGLINQRYSYHLQNDDAPIRPRGSSFCNMVNSQWIAWYDK